MKQQEFIIKFYGKSELAMLYYDGDSPENGKTGEDWRIPILLILNTLSLHRRNKRSGSPPSADRLETRCA